MVGEGVIQRMETSKWSTIDSCTRQRKVMTWNVEGLKNSRRTLPQFRKLIDATVRETQKLTVLKVWAALVFSPLKQTKRNWREEAKKHDLKLISWILTASACVYVNAEEKCFHISCGQFTVFSRSRLVRLIDFDLHFQTTEDEPQPWGVLVYSDFLPNEAENLSAAINKHSSSGYRKIAVLAMVISHLSIRHVFRVVSLARHSPKSLSHYGLVCVRFPVVFWNDYVGFTESRHGKQ